MFRIFRSFAVATLVAGLAYPPAAHASATGVQEKTVLQAAMQRHIDRLTIDGAFLRLDEKTGTVEQLYPATAHHIVMKMGPYYVLCFDFRDKSGKKVEIDFYMARRKNSFAVFHTAVSNRALLQSMMQDGKVTRAD